jgi:hypothetical protein
MSVRVLTPSARSDAAHARAAELVQQQRELVDRIDKFFRDVAEVSELLSLEGSRWAGPVLDPPLEAAFEVWSSPPEHELGAPPLMRHEDAAVDEAAARRQELVDRIGPQPLEAE